MTTDNPFKAMIAAAAAQTDHGKADPDADWFPDERDGNSPKQDALTAFAKAAAQVEAEHGCAVIWKPPRIGRKRTKAEYVFWEKPVMAFIEMPQTLDLGPTDLAHRFGPGEANFKVTVDTFKAPLSKPARQQAAKLLRSRGYKLNLPAIFSVRDIQKAMKRERDALAGVQQFKPKIEIIGDTVICNGKSFKMQPTGSGKMRIRTQAGWLPVDALSAFLSEPP